MKKISGILVMVFLTLFGTVLIGEFFVVPTVRGLPRDIILMGFAALPNQMVDDTRINSMGFTGDVIERAKSPGTVRMLTLGGSAMFNRRMIDRLKKRFNTVSDHPIELVGAALRTHTTISSVLKYRYFSPYQFDFVFIYHEPNDLWANHRADSDFVDDYSHLNSWYKRNFWVEHSAICRFIYNKWIYRAPPSVQREKFVDVPGEAIFMRNMRILIEDIQRDHTIPVLMTFAWSIPSHYTEEKFRAHSVGYNNPTNYDRHPVELWGSPEYVMEGLQHHNAIVRQLAQEYDVPFIDQEELIGKDLHWYGDPVHLSEEGTEKFIDHIVIFFLKQGFLVP